jgi:cytoskeletal protein RodZ
LNKQIPSIIALSVFLLSSLTVASLQEEVISPAFAKNNATKDDQVKSDSTSTTTSETEKEEKSTEPSSTTTTTTKSKTLSKKESNTSDDNQTKPSTKETLNNPNDNETTPTVQTSEIQTNTNQSIESLENTNTTGSDPLVCSSDDLLKCYWKMTFHLTLAPGDKYSDFMIHITQNPRHIADFPGSKTSVRYLLPGDYAVSLIYKGGTPNPLCVGIAPVGDSRTCSMVSPNMPPPPPGPGELHVAESVKFVNGSFATIPPVKVGTITVKGNNPNPSHFQLSSGDDEEGIFVKLGPGKYSAAISLPSDYKLAGTDGNCSGVMTKGGHAFCHFAVQQTAKPDQNGTTPPPPTSNQPHTAHTTKIIIKKESPVVENYIRIFITTNPDVLRQLQLQAQQQPTATINSTLIPLDTIQLCRQAGDQNCVLSSNNFRILAANITKDVFGSWSLNGVVQNNSTAPLNQVRAVLQLYNSTGNLVGSASGIISPQNLGPIQNGIIFLQVHPSELLGTPKFYRIAFDY